MSENSIPDSNLNKGEQSDQDHLDLAPWIKGANLIKVDLRHLYAEEAQQARIAALSPQERARLCGPCFNPSIMRSIFRSMYLRDLELPSSLININLVNSGVYPFVEACNNSMIPLVAYVFANLKCESVGEHLQHVKIAVAIGEASGVGLPAVLKDSEAACLEKIVAVVRYGLENVEIIEEFCTPTAELYDSFKADAAIGRLYPDATDADSWPPSRDFVANLSTMSIQSAMKILHFLALNTGKSAKLISVELFAHAFCARMKMGSEGAGLSDKIVEACRQVSQVTIRLDEKAMKLAYEHYLMHVNETNAAAVFSPYLERLPLPELRFRFLASYPPFRSLTDFLLVGRAMQLFKNFRWSELMRWASDDIARFAIARARVKGNAYFAFSRDFPLVDSYKFRTLAYVCIALLKRLGGRYGFLRNSREENLGGVPARRAAIRRLIDNYAADYYYDQPVSEELMLSNLRKEDKSFYEFCTTITEDIFAV